MAKYRPSAGPAETPKNDRAVALTYAALLRAFYDLWGKLHSAKSDEAAPFH